MFIKVLPVLLIVLTASAFASDRLSRIGGFVGGSPTSKFIYHTNNFRYPFRIHNGNYCDLRPLFQYYREVNSGKKNAVNPMPNWRYIQTAKVQQVLLEGILFCRYNYVGDRYVESQELYFLKNYPGFKNLSEEKTLKVFIAIKYGTFTYTTVLGATATVEAYDYGIPYDPFTKGPDGKAVIISNPTP